ncbi:hypothetical protein [Vulcaniibacterium tengchongense]|uniref:Uncharacterized protein n=1 Tax=Vulcaniibacterium tengchongense TaxID=1273429 RepID=A0A3N4VJD8_9GAMM|nr:hypothetical protein [Vulcaniibacterium tengchongense]RPE81813.1 hypothetical protein EDC50_1015 [Vulcaniibacterium tengchongense]
MARSRDVATGDLFAAIPRPVPALPGSMDFRTRVAVLVGAMLDDARAADPELDRYEVAARVSRLVGKEVSKHMLDAYTAESREAYNTPAWLMPALEHACRSHRYSEWLAEVRGGRLVLGAAALDAEIGAAQEQIEALREHVNNLRMLRRRAR